MIVAQEYRLYKDNTKTPLALIPNNTVCDKEMKTLFFDHACPNRDPNFLPNRGLNNFLFCRSHLQTGDENHAIQ